MLEKDEILSSAPAFVLMEVADQISASLEEDIDIKLLPPAKRTVMLLSRLHEALYDCAGLHSFYVNGVGDLALDMPGALREVGAEGCAQVIEEANALFDPEDLMDWDKRQIVGREEPLWSKLDAAEERFEEQEDFARLTAAYILEHYEELR